MNNKEYLLTCLQEECAEIIQAATKYLRFGGDSTFIGKFEKTNEEHLVEEIWQLKALIVILEKEGIIFSPGNGEELVKYKTEKVDFYMQRSRELGTLDVLP